MSPLSSKVKCLLVVVVLNLNSVDACIILGEKALDYSKVFTPSGVV